jgi:membrane-associated phospholipid phosphatase
MLAHHSRSFDHLAKTVNPLGTAHRLIPAMAVTYVTAALTGHQSLATGVLNTAGAYIASDVVESVLKPVVGRQRPDVAGNSHRFRPFSRQGDWHSFPSAHVAHVTAIATAVEMQTHSRTIAVLCDGLVTLVAADRIYEDQHWSSDVTATAALTAMISSATVQWLNSRLTNRHHDGPSDR